ncbi:hypothetical protein HDV63DRAFT_375204, partial [Trichoderma sp. SZMC 28014]
MYKRKFADDLLAAACKKAKINSSITQNHCNEAFKLAPMPMPSLSELLFPDPREKRKRQEECIAAFREPRRIKTSHVGSNWTRYPPSLSPASKFQIFSNQTSSKIKDNNNNQTSLIRNAIESAAKDTTTTTALPIRLATPQRRSPAFTDPSTKENKVRRPGKKQTKKKTTTQQQVQGNDKKQQTYNQGQQKQQKQRNPKTPAQKVSMPSSKYSHILKDWYAVELDHLEPVI